MGNKLIRLAGLKQTTRILKRKWLKKAFFLLHCALKLEHLLLWLPPAGWVLTCMLDCACSLISCKLFFIIVRNSKRRRGRTRSRELCCMCAKAHTFKWQEANWSLGKNFAHCAPAIAIAIAITYPCPITGALSKLTLKAFSQFKGTLCAYLLIDLP